MQKKILIVEDNDLNLKLFRDLLTAHSYEVIEQLGKTIAAIRREYRELWRR